MEELAAQLRGKVVVINMKEAMDRPGMRFDAGKDNIVYVCPKEGSELDPAELNKFISDYLKEKHPRMLSVSSRPGGVDERHNVIFWSSKDLEPYRRAKFVRLSSFRPAADPLLAEFVKHMNG